MKLEWSKWWKTGFLIETVCAEHTLAAGKRSDWHRSRIARAGRRERCRKIHTHEARGGGVVIIANVASLDRFQAQPIWEIPAKWEFAGSLDRDRWNQVFAKGTDPRIDSYSGFFDNGHRKATGLGEFLTARGVKTVYILGLATDYCIKYTALDACGLGFATFVIEDGCRGVNLQPQDAEQALTQMEQAGVTRINSDDVVCQQFG